jgi:hypothetical protein
MKTLFERLEPEVLTVLEIKKITIPYIIEELYNDLKCNTNWLNLKYRNICYLKFYLELENFSPTIINNLFIKEEL